MDWDKEHGWAVPLRSFLLKCGREVHVTHIEVARTYGGLLEGTPNKRLNAVKIESLKQSHSDVTEKVSVQVIPHSIEERMDKQSREASLLPPVYITLWLESDPFEESQAFSAMRVIYFCNQSNFLNLDMAIQNIVNEIDWNSFAVDCMP